MQTTNGEDLYKNEVMEIQSEPISKVSSRVSLPSSSPPSTASSYPNLDLPTSESSISILDSICLRTSSPSSTPSGVCSESCSPYPRSTKTSATAVAANEASDHPNSNNNTPICTRGDLNVPSLASGPYLPPSLSAASVTGANVAIDVPNQNKLAIKVEELLKKGRYRFQPKQLDELIKEFLKAPKKTALEYQKLGERIGLTKQQVCKWFKNKREFLKKVGIEVSPSIRFQLYQTEQLEKEFLKAPNKKGFEYRKLGERIGLTKQQVTDWFKHKRQSLKKVRIEVLPSNRYQRYQTEQLEKEFLKAPKLTKLEYRKLGERIGLTIVQVQKWFSYKRILLKKEPFLLSNKLKSYQTDSLEIEFQKCRYRNMRKYQEIGEQIGLTKEEVCNWFMYKRRKDQDELSQTDSLEQEFQKDQYRNMCEYQEIGERIGLTKQQVNKSRPKTENSFQDSTLKQDCVDNFNVIYDQPLNQASESETSVDEPLNLSKN